MTLLYQTYYGIHNHFAANDKVPFGTQTYFPTKEPTYKYSLGEFVKLYRSRRIKELGMSFEEFLNLPIDVTEELLEACSSYDKTEGKLADDLLGNMK